MRQLILAFASAVQSIDADNWDSLMGRDNPFVRHAYLLSLEQSLSACAATGWRPHHLCVFDATGSEFAQELAPDTVIISPKDAADFMALPLLVLMPLYQKSHSYGEYVFDWAWAQAYERHGLEYYPKLLNAIPFTPVQGRRMGLSPTLLAEEAQQLSLAVLSCLNGQLANADADTPMSSWHSLFVSSSQQALFTEASNHTALRRLSTQFHWHNRGYADFAAFLAALTSRKRKNILKERAQLQPYGLQYEFVAGAEISSQQWQHFIECYQLTYLKRSGHRGYLTPTFFNMIAERLAEQIVLLVVSDAKGQMVAVALYFTGRNEQGQTCLFGRYWGSIVELEGLHFEACYYQGIEYCIAHGIDLFDAGAQGEHKVLRGFEPVALYSYHNIAHPEFKRAIAHFTEEEAAQMEVYMQQMREVLPYKKGQ
ncbi:MULTISPECIES: GNAT family N-acetyltransferase [Shewanella]|uniref:GNAT family N-acetyltransferase n=1 Tax=Shewanella TaxID=22 RepID=UPI00201AA566|nr:MULTISPECIES: GNAT family N-acetyltransferase [Shewanella]